MAQPIWLLPFALRGNPGRLWSINPRGQRPKGQAFPSRHIPFLLRSLRLARRV